MSAGRSILQFERRIAMVKGIVNKVDNKSNFLETEKISKLLPKFAIPSIIGGLVTASYNIIDQIFIGNSVGLLGNAATNIAFPVVLVCTAVAIMSGVGCSAGFNMEVGKGNRDTAGKIVGNCIMFMAVIGVLISAITLIFLTPLLNAFGATENVLPYAQTYLFITAWAIPFSIFGVGGSIIIRSDGSPRYALFSILTGAVLHVMLEMLFIFGLGMGIAGAAYATVIGQAVTAIMVAVYFRRFKTLSLDRACFVPRLSYVSRVTSLGMGPFVNNLSMFVVQIMLNNALNYYGAMSQYGSDIPLACVGVITKLNSIFAAIVIGIAQGVQPIISHNYGAKNYKRVKEAAVKAITIMLCISFAVFLCCQLIPRPLVAIFGTGTELYFQFAERYLRIFMMLICVNGMQITAGNLFTSIGKARLSVFISLTRQVMFLPPLILLMPRIYGIDGIMYAGPIADGMCVLVAVLLLAREYKGINALQDSTVNNAPPA